MSDDLIQRARVCRACRDYCLDGQQVGSMPDLSPVVPELPGPYVRYLVVRDGPGARSLSAYEWSDLCAFLGTPPTAWEAWPSIYCTPRGGVGYGYLGWVRTRCHTTHTDLWYAASRDRARLLVLGRQAPVEHQLHGWYTYGLTDTDGHFVSAALIRHGRVLCAYRATQDGVLYPWDAWRNAVWCAWHDMTQEGVPL